MLRRAVRVAACAAAFLALAAPAGAASPGFFGLVPQGKDGVSEADFRLMNEGGVDQVRLLFHWGALEPAQGTYDWTTSDETVGRAARQGVRALPFLYGSTAWAVEADGNCDPAAGDCSVFAPDSPTTREGFAAFARAAVERYGPDGEFWRKPPPCEMPPNIPFVCPPPPEAPCRCEEPLPIQAWQVWNEQNSPKYFAPRADVGSYAKLLDATAAAIRAADPGAEVILGGMWGPDSGGKRPVVAVSRYLKLLYRVEGVRESFDTIALHPYAGDIEGMRDQITSARRVVKRAGDGEVGTWVTELGWASGGPGANPYVKGLRGQAQLLRESFKLLTNRRRAFRLRGVFWYTWRDGGGGNSICSWCGHAGLRSADGAAKPAWKQFTNFTGGH